MIDATTRSALSKLLGDDVAFDAPMSRCTSMRVGGPADALAAPRDRSTLCALLALASECGTPVTLLGEGFNAIVRDDGLDGIALRLRAFRRLERTGPGEVLAEAGVRHASITRFCVDEALTGLEFAAGIPGSIGGWIAMNAGIGVLEMKDVVRAVEVVDGDGSEMRWLDADQMGFEYRSATGLGPDVVVLAARFALNGAEPGSVKQRVDEHMAKRARTQPLNVPSCGSVFRNPEGDYAGRLIEAAGLKGASVGGARVTEIHANFIATEAGASAQDVVDLIEKIRDRVAAETGIRLETEVKILGRVRS